MIVWRTMRITAHEKKALVFQSIFIDDPLLYPFSAR